MSMWLIGVSWGLGTSTERKRAAGEGKRIKGRQSKEVNFEYEDCQESHRV